MRFVRVPGGTFELWSPSHCRTVFDDGILLPASPSGDPEQAFTALETGYGTDIGRMVIEHELAHHVTASWMGRPRSSALHRAAQGLRPTSDDGEEETVVLALQRVRNGGHPRSRQLPYTSREIARWLRLFTAALEALGRGL